MYEKTVCRVVKYYFSLKRLSMIVIEYIACEIFKLVWVWSCDSRDLEKLYEVCGLLYNDKWYKVRVFYVSNGVFVNYQNIYFTRDNSIKDQ